MQKPGAFAAAPLPLASAPGRIANLCRLDCTCLPCHLSAVATCLIHSFMHAYVRADGHIQKQSAGTAASVCWHTVSSCAGCIKPSDSKSPSGMRCNISICCASHLCIYTSPYVCCKAQTSPHASWMHASNEMYMHTV